MKRLEIGVFPPIAKNGFIRSTNTPPYHPSYRDTLEIVQLAERIGLDYAFAMLKWRGFGGTTEYWDSALESFSLMAALAPVTRRLKLIATVNPLLHHPVSMAKMAATIQDVSDGRLGLNIITGAALVEYAQMGIIPDDYDRNRYAYATEWVQVLKRLWSEARVTHHGEYFHLEDCVSEPKPRPAPFLVCAGTSDEGLRFTAREADYAFITSPSAGGLREVGARARALAAEQDSTVRCCTPFVAVLRDTKAEAEAYWEYLNEGADAASLSKRAEVYANEGRSRDRAGGGHLFAEGPKISTTAPTIGGPRDVADAIIDLAVNDGIDNIALIFPDFLDGLRRFGADVMPLLREALSIGAQPMATGETQTA